MSFEVPKWKESMIKEGRSAKTFWELVQKAEMVFADQMMGCGHFGGALD
jgi:hypothetical protein